MSPWRHRLLLFAQRFGPPTTACLACMPGGLEKAFSAAHWALAMKTGLITGLLAVILSFTPAGRLYGNRFTNALMMGLLTAFGDAYSHADHYGGGVVEPLVTGLIAAALTLLASYVLEDRARRLRAWSPAVRRPPRS